MGDLRVFTIGYTGKTAQQFFTLLNNNNVKTVVDIRLYPDSQLSGFAKKRDLPFFLRTMGHIRYTHYLELAPPKELLKAYRDNQIEWSEYETVYMKVLKDRKAERFIDEVLYINSIKEPENSCLLCSEDAPAFCHRRLAAEYFKVFLPNLEIHHLM